MSGQQRKWRRGLLGALWNSKHSHVLATRMTEIADPVRQQASTVGEDRQLLERLMVRVPFKPCDHVANRMGDRVDVGVVRSFEERGIEGSARLQRGRHSAEGDLNVVRGKVGKHRDGDRVVEGCHECADVESGVGNQSSTPVGETRTGPARLHRLG